MAKKNIWKTGNVPIPGALKAIDDLGIVAYAGDIYDDNLGKTQREINQDAQAGLARWGNLTGEIEDQEDLIAYLTAGHITVADDQSLADALGIEDASTQTSNAVDPYIQIYDPISNTYKGNGSVLSVEYGTQIVGASAALLARFIQGSSGGLDFSTSAPAIKITQGKTSVIYECTQDLLTNPVGLQYRTTKNDTTWNVDFNSDVYLSFCNKEGVEELGSLLGEQTVTVTKDVNVIASKILDANNKPTVISGPKTTTSIQDYPASTVKCKLSFTAFQYMYLHRSQSLLDLTNFGDAAGKTGFLLRRQATKSSWTCTSTTSVNQYYYLLVPASYTLSSMYTTFLGNNSLVAYTLLGTVNMQGATSKAYASYRLYRTNEPVAFGDGSMTFTFG